MKIGIGSDQNGFELKEIIKRYIKELNYEVIDYGCFSKDAVDYPDVAFEVSKAIREDREIDRAILICGTGIGMCIAANKYPRIRAALAHDIYSAERAQLSNNAQILTLGAQIIGPKIAKDVVKSYLDSHWSGGSQQKVDKIIKGEREYKKSIYW